MGISTRKFYYWAALPPRMDADSSGCQINHSGLSRPASIMSSGGTVPFLPVSIIGHREATELEIELAKGMHTVRLKGSVDVGLLQAAISRQAGQLDGPGHGGR